tara:strand:+ start:10038 stop:11288 length:1251 start_codon:yes stop_codon:yes gene_type:complete
MSGISKFHKTISSSLSLKSYYLNIGKWFLGGQLSTLTSPITLWHNGSTYSLGYENNITNNQVWIVKQTGFNIESNTVGIGTVAPEPLNHPTPLLIIDDLGYIYVIQNSFHVSPFNLWRSDNPEDISSFSLIGQFDTDGAYLTMISQNNTNAVFVTRNSLASSDGFHQSILEVNLLTAAYTKTQLTYADYNTTGIRHYPLFTYHKVGNSNIYYGFINHRRDSDLTYLKVSAWKSTDLVTFSNLDETFSKDVVSNGVLTNAELEANFKFVESSTNDLNRTIFQGAIQVDDDIYVAYNANNEIKIEKYLSGSATPSDTYTFPTDIRGSFLYWNTTKIFVLVQDNTLDGISGIYSMDLDLTNLKLEAELKQGLDYETFSYYGIPNNLHEVPNGEYYLGIGRSDTTQTPEVGVVPYNVFKK